MQKYRIVFTPRVDKYLSRLSSKERERLFDKIEELPNCPNIQKMQGNNPFLFRLRIGSVRVIYEKHDDQYVIFIIKIWPRGDVYK